MFSRGKTKFICSRFPLSEKHKILWVAGNYPGLSEITAMKQMRWQNCTKTLSGWNKTLIRATIGLADSNSHPSNVAKQGDCVLSRFVIYLVRLETLNKICKWPPSPIRNVMAPQNNRKGWDVYVWTGVLNPYYVAVIIKHQIGLNIGKLHWDNLFCIGDTLTPLINRYEPEAVQRGRNGAYWLEAEQLIFGKGSGRLDQLL